MTEPTPEAAASAQALQNYLDSLLTGDLDRIRGHFAEDATWTIHGSLPISGVHRGADAIMAFLTSAGGLFVPSSHQLTFGPLFASGDTAILEWNVSGIGTASGLPYNNDYCGIFVIRDGLIQTVREYVDSDHMRTVLYQASAPR